MPLCITQNLTGVESDPGYDNRYCIGEFGVKIYLEGWDFSVVDEELTHMFNLGLTFEIN